MSQIANKNNNRPVSNCKQHSIYLGGGNNPIESIVGGAMISSARICVGFFIMMCFICFR